MIRRVYCIIHACIFILLLASGFSCEKAEFVITEPIPPVQDQGYYNLTQKDHVLKNLELCYNQRNFTRYAELLDDPHFTYFFSDEDFSSGKTPAQWGREEDLACHQRMFDPNSINPRTLSIRLKLQYPTDQWIETTPDQGQFPGETWYFKSVSYDLTLVVEAQPENITYLAQNLKAMFTIRRVNKGGKVIWQIVEWRDDVKI